MHNKQISDLFDQMAEIMEILGEDHFRISTYRKVARVIGDCPQDIASLAAGGQLQTLAGIGKSSAEKINEFIHHGSIDAHQELLKKIPPGLLDLLKVPGFGPKGVRAVWKKLNVTNLPELQQAISDHSLETLPGFGVKKAQSLARGIEFIRSSQNRILLADALAIADLIVGQLHQLDCLDRIELAGSLRRCCETIGDIDLLAQADGDDNAKKIIQTFTQLPGAREVLATGQTKASIRFAEPDIYPDLIQVDLRVISSESMGAAWQYFTGSKYHNIRLREIAGRKKLKLNEYGLFKGDKQIAGQNELQIYKKLGLSYIPPTLREDRGEIESAQKGKLPEIVQLPDVRGDLHMHSPESDGRSSIEQLIGAARLLGYEYIAIADHSQSTAIANGLDADRLLKHTQRIKKLNETLDGFTILASSEVDILADGDLDYPDEVLAELDFVTASIHSGMTGARDKLTDRILRAMENPYVNCIAHPTGRMLGVREAMALDIDAIIAQALRTHTALEINAQPLRLDLNDIHIRQAVDAGVKLIINTDAHDTASLKLMRFGVATAQRGWAKKTDILNCQPISIICDWVKDKRTKHNP